MTRRLIIFDVDGTLVDGTVLDHASFNLAFQEVAGEKLDESMWGSFPEITGMAVFHHALRHKAEAVPALAGRMVDSYLLKLQTGHGLDGTALQAFPGAVELVAALRESSDLGVAIATGCWRETALFKLAAAGFDLTGIPFACSSDRHSRADIIRLAAERAGVPVEQSVYVGDGVWDLRATQQLGIPFIGTGRKVERLRAAGATFTLEQLTEAGLREVLGRM